MNALNCKEKMKVVTNKKQPAYMSRINSTTCNDEEHEKFLRIETVDNDTVTVRSRFNGVTFFIKDIEPYFGGE